MAISAALTDPGETLSVVVSGVPEGATLTAGINNGDGSWILSADEIDGVAIIPAEHDSEDFELTITAYSQEPENGDVAQIGVKNTVIVNASADTPYLYASDAVIISDGDSGNDDIHGTHHDDDDDSDVDDDFDDVFVGGGGDDDIKGHEGDDVIYGDWGQGDAGPLIVPLDIEASLADVDASEVLVVTISGVPDGATLSAGTVSGDGTWILAPDNLAGLSVNLPEGEGQDFALTIEAHAVDTDPDSNVQSSAVTATTINVSYGDVEDGNDKLYGGHGDDQIHGGGGDDKIHGDHGDDVLYGDAGDDKIKGGHGDDVIVGGAGDDELSGGKGGDTFLFNLDSDIGRDIVKDFKLGDELRFEGPEFSPEDVEIVQDGKDTIITFDGSDVEITLNKVDADHLTSYSVTEDPSGDIVVVYNSDAPGG